MGGVDGSVQLDTAQAERQVWLLKMPSLVANAWTQHDNKAGGADRPLAKITCTYDPLAPDPSAALEFSMELMGSEYADIPKSYNLNLQKDMVPTQIFSEAQAGKIAIEGQVEKKFDMKPNSKVHEEYRQLCRNRDQKFNSKTRTIQVLTDDRGHLMRPAIPVSTYTQGSSAYKDLNNKKRPAPKGNEGKRIRRERNELEDIMFKLFERQSNWALKLLVQETDQPVAFLKEILNDLCIYNKRGTNQGTYELKPEYKKAPAAEEQQQQPGSSGS